MTSSNLVSAPRNKAAKLLTQFISLKGQSGLVYFRGRRRIGKTTLLKELTATNPDLFYFTGIADESNRNSLNRFAKTWDNFTGKPQLSRYRSTELDWPLCFDQITAFAAQYPEKIVTVAFDEIQWIAKRRSGLVGTIKDKWIDWERASNLKIIICGSSNKFFVEQAGGEEKILRGIKTHADIVLAPLTAAEVRTHYFLHWKIDEVLMLYMMIGGVPYYLNQVSRSSGFIRATNEAFFTKKTVFLSEVDEVLNVEFNRAGVRTIKKLFGELGSIGSTFAQLAKKLAMSNGALYEALTKLVDYGLLQEREILPLSAGKRSDTQYFLTDPYLFFYFACLESMRSSIEENEKQLLVSNLIPSESSLYIASFSGRAFEIFVRNLLTSDSNDQQEKLLDLMGIPDRDFELYDVLPNENYGDFILIHKKLRTIYVIECKWTQYLEIVKEGLEQVLQFSTPESQKRIERVVITNYEISESFSKKALTKGIKVITAAALF